VGRTIQGGRCRETSNIVKTRLQGDKIFRLHSENQVELLAGYTAIPSPITNEPAQHWIILAVTQLDNALFGLKIKIILFVLTVGLLEQAFW